MQSWRPSETEQRVSDGLSFFRRPHPHTRLPPPPTPRYTGTFPT
ncbi:hypothetical protein NEIELOOT_02155 [Neisseria elongata subsp. glycolytica ATCC 29315]|uniref:Uncharacterized protein n=1 Tax=Neisseria elongata subsp. glycolytica ATCC 29315 TaxID=546263 RepID=D4DSV9_NEIEG|nr:hypothetical protein NEIELOOT_02155 [Neisseria elongata subsp. glycolytica ATCC 29315]